MNLKRYLFVLFVFLHVLGLEKAYAQPSNDACANAILLPVGIGSCSSPLYTNVNATTVGDPTTPACWLPNSKSHTVWFYFQASSADVEISTNFSGTLANTQIAVYSGTCGSFTQLACQENVNTAAGLLHTDVILHGLTVGNNYYVMVDGNGTQTGDFGICVQQTNPTSPPLPAQDCETAQFLCNMSNIVVPDGIGGVGVNQTNPSCFGAPGERAAWWYSFTALTSGTLAFTITPNAVMDYDFAVYNTTASCPGTELSCNWDPSTGALGTTGLGCAGLQCNPTFAVVAGQTYSILVDRFTGTSSSGFTLNFAGTTATFASPIPVFSSTSACLGTATNFTNTTLGTNTYSWTFGDGTTSNLANPSHTYATAGTYQATLLVTSVPGGCQNSVTHPVVVSPIPVVEAGTAASICAGSCVTLSGSTTATGYVGPTSFTNSTTYAIPDGSTIGVNAPIVVSGISPAAITATSIQSVCININHTWDSDLDIFLKCPDGTLLELSTDNGSIDANYTNTCFSPTAGTSITAGIAPFTGTYLPEQLFSALNGCTANGTWNLFVQDDSGLDTGSIVNWSITFNNTIPPFTWSPTTAMTNSTTLTPSVCPTTTTTYTLTANGAGGCLATDQVTVAVVAQPNAGIDGSTTICNTDTTPINLFTLISGEQTGGIWTRTNGTGGTLNGSTGIFTPAIGTANSTFVYTVSGTSPCLPDTSTVTLNVTVGTPPTYTASAVNCSPGSVTFSGISTGATFNWVSGPVGYTFTTPTTANLSNLPQGTFCVNITNPGSPGGLVNTTLFAETFESGTSNWTIDNSNGPNRFIVNNVYPGGSCVTGTGTFTVAAVPNQPAAVTAGPNSNYLHISATTTTGATCGAGSSAPFPPLNANFDSQISNQKATLNTVINTTGKSNVVFSFYWLAQGETNGNGANDFGVIEYSINGGVAWIQAGVVLRRQTTWLADSRTDPSWSNQADLRFRIRWENDNASSVDPPLAIDQITITADANLPAGCATTVQECYVVNSAHTIALTSAASTESQSICVSTALSPITYTLGGGATGANVTGLPTGVTATVAGTTLTISGTPTTTTGSPFTYAITTTGNSCTAATDGGTITITNGHTLTPTSASNTFVQTACINSPIATITYTLGGGATGANVTGLPTGVTATVAGTTLTISGTPTTTTGSPFTYAITTTGNSCTAATDGGTITINPIHTIALTSAASTETQSICVSTALSPITYTLGGGATGANVTGLPTGVTATVAGTTLTISGTPTTTTGSPFTYAITTTGNSCTAATDGGTITINPIHTIALTSAASTETQSICVSTALSPITYTLGGGATGANVTGLPTGVTATVAGTTLTISGTPTTTTGSPFTYAITTTGNSCTAATDGGTIMINPIHTIALTSSANENQVLCINTAITPITYTLGGGATGANVTGLPTGITAAVTGTILTISGSPATLTGSPFTYTITTSGNACTLATGTGSFTVNPVHTIALTSAIATENQTLCENTAITAITYTLGGGATGANVTGLPTGVTATVAGTTLTISGTPTTTTGSPFTYAITTTGNSCTAATDGGTITINPIHTIALTSAASTETQSICVSTALSPITYTLGGGATGANVTGLPAGVTAAVSGTTVTISGTPTSTAGSPYVYNITTTGSTCLVATDSGIINVKARPVLNPISNQDYCPSVLVPASNWTSTPAGATYAWTNSNSTIGLAGSGIGSTPSFTSANVTAIQQIATIDILPTLNGCVGSAASYTVTIHPKLIPQFAFGSLVQLCEGSTPPALPVTTTNTPPISGSWSPASISSTTSGNYVFTPSSGLCVVSATLQVLLSPLPVVSLPSDGIVCVTQAGVLVSSYSLDTQLNPSQYSFVWSSSTGVLPAETNPSLLVPASGTYSVLVTNTSSLCSNSATAVVGSTVIPESATISYSAFFSDEQAVTVNVVPAGDYLYQLDNGPFQSSNYFYNIPTGVHTVTVKNSCDQLAPIPFRIVDYPKFFTPNNDGFNDVWNVFDLSDQTDATIYLFDRYGKLLKQISTVGEGWDGTYNGAEMPSTDYWFKINYKENGQFKEFKSHFSLKR